MAVVDDAKTTTWTTNVFAQSRELVFVNHRVGRPDVDTPLGLNVSSFSHSLHSEHCGVDAARILGNVRVSFKVQYCCLSPFRHVSVGVFYDLYVWFLNLFENIILLKICAKSSISKRANAAIKSVRRWTKTISSALLLGFSLWIYEFLFDFSLIARGAR